MPLVCRWTWFLARWTQFLQRIKAFVLTNLGLACHVSVLRMCSTSLNRHAEFLTADFAEDTDGKRFPRPDFGLRRVGDSKMQAHLYPWNPHHSHYYCCIRKFPPAAAVFRGADFQSAAGWNRLRCRQAPNAFGGRGVRRVENPRSGANGITARRHARFIPPVSFLQHHL